MSEEEEKQMVEENKKLPDEQGGVHVEGHIRIFDPMVFRIPL